MTKRAIVHIEIPSENHEAAATFYTEAFGWECHRANAYMMFQTGSIGGNFLDAGEENPIGKMVIYIDSQDLEADGKVIEAKGGKLLSPVIQIGDFGWMRFFEDPFGNKLALWKDA